MSLKPKDEPKHEPKVEPKAAPKAVEPAPYVAPPLEEGQSPTRPPYSDYPAEPAPRVPTLLELTPATAEHTVTAFVTNLVGTDFAIGDKVFADELEASEVVVVDSSHITAGFMGIVVETPRDVAIMVVTAAGEASNTLPFSYTAPAGTTRKKGS